MRNKLYIALIWGWFFAMQAVYEGDAKVSTVVGPFKTEMECKAELENAKEVTKGMEVKYKKCSYIQES